MKTFGPRAIQHEHLMNEKTESGWWYYDKGGIDVLSESLSTGEVLFVRLTWGRIREAMRRAEREA